MSHRRAPRPRLRFRAQCPTPVSESICPPHSPPLESTPTYKEHPPMLRLPLLALLLLPTLAPAQESTAEYIRNHYQRKTVKIAVRDGVKLHTIIYAPKDDSQKYPMMLRRTPYGIAPYDEEQMPGTLGPNSSFVR